MTQDIDWPKLIFWIVALVVCVFIWAAVIRAVIR